MERKLRIHCECCLNSVSRGKRPSKTDLISSTVTLKQDCVIMPYLVTRAMCPEGLLYARCFLEVIWFTQLLVAGMSSSILQLRGRRLGKATWLA